MGAHFSEDRQYRYALWRIWNENRPVIMFIGLNPSTANERKNDPTIRRVMRFTNDWGYGGFYMMNLFAWVTPYPRDLERAADPVGLNDEWLEKIYNETVMPVYVWGSFPQATERAKRVREMCPGGYCLGTSKMGNPLHPLYLPVDTRPQMFIAND
jgi:hypothetical protein